MPPFFRRRRGALRWAWEVLAGGLIAFVVLEGAARALLLARARLDAPRAPAFELYAIGGSTMHGQPFDNAATRFSVPAAVAGALGGAVDGRPIVTRDLSRSGESLYAEWGRLRLALAGRPRAAPGALLIYSGHNEGEPRPFCASLGCRLARALERNVAMRSVVLSETLYLARRARLLEREGTLDEYRFYLRSCVALARDAGLRPVLATAASDIADVEPPAESEDEPALVLYREGREDMRRGRDDDARARFWDAVDASSRRRYGRATRAQNDAVRETARRLGVPLADAAAAFEAAAPRGLPGRDLFVDFQHPNLRGYALLAGTYAAVLAAAVGRDAPPAPDPERLRRDFAIDDAALAGAYVQGGEALLRYAAPGHPRPEGIAALARADFSRALASDPESWTARLGLALADACARGELFREERGLEPALDLLHAATAPDAPLAALLPRVGGGAAAELQRARVSAVLARDDAAPAELTLARDLLRALGARGTADADSTLDRAEVSARLKDAADARAALARLDRGRLDARRTLRLSRLRERLGDARDARGALDAWLKRGGAAETDAAQVLSARAVLEAADDPAAAEADLSRALALDPGSGPATVTLGGLLEKAGKRAQAAALYRSALARPGLSGGLRPRELIEADLRRLQ